MPGIALSTPKAGTETDHYGTPKSSSTCPPFTPHTSGSSLTFDTPKTPHTPTLVFQDGRSADIGWTAKVHSSLSIGAHDDQAGMASEDGLGRYLMVSTSTSNSAKLAPQISNIPKRVTPEAVKEVINV